jgi:hypothetical protein
MINQLPELEGNVRKCICSVCTSRDTAGNCGLEVPATCALFRLFPSVVNAIRDTNSDRIGDYVVAIRRNICPMCPDQAADGSCEKRDQAQCALDAYLLLIVDAIEEAMGKNLPLRSGASNISRSCPDLMPTDRESLRPR